MLPLIAAYAETHYRLLFSRYFRQCPEIYADCPFRVLAEPEGAIPIAIIVRDAHRFPVRLDSVRVALFDGSRKLAEHLFELGFRITEPYWSTLLETPYHELPTDRQLGVTVTIAGEIRDKHFQAVQHNLPGVPSVPFSCMICESSGPWPEGAYPGDAHHHSRFTDDQVEFGADIPVIRRMALAEGLRWTFLTDHSYDLDDADDNYLRNDPNLPKWKRMRRECAAVSDERFRLIPGEELSAGNRRGRNVHLLVIDSPDFFPGSGDSAERWLHNRPDLRWEQLPAGLLTIPAHPAEYVTRFERMFFRRGSWCEDELLTFDFVQAVNATDSESGIALWKRLLARGWKGRLVAGNDAHGDFNLRRYVRWPMLRLGQDDAHVFGKFTTVFHGPDNDPIRGFRDGHLLVSTGPYVDFRLYTSEGEFAPGETVRGAPLRIEADVRLRDWLGGISEFTAWVFDAATGHEQGVKMGVETVRFPRKGYVRLSLTTDRGERAFTNPVWF
jgi:hypothetical protein